MGAVRSGDSTAHDSPCIPCSVALQEVKAALDAAIAAFARRADLAEALWERLLQSVVVAPNPPNGDLSSLMAAVPRYDITYQLNEVEVRAQRRHHLYDPPKLVNPYKSQFSGVDRVDDCFFCCVRVI